MAKDKNTADLFEADGVTPKAGKKDDATAAAEALRVLETKAARAEGEAAGLKAALAAKPADKKQPDKVFTRQELRAQVNEGKITEDQMDDILEKQLTAKLTKTVESRVTASQADNKITAQIDAYVEVFPDINKDGSPTRAKIQAAFDELVGLGDSPEAFSTELKAIKIALGPLKAAAGRRPAPESHEEVGGAGDSNERPDTQGWAKGLGPNQKKHYQKMVERGMYKGYSDPRLLAEVKNVRRAH